MNNLRYLTARIATATALCVLVGSNTVFASDLKIAGAADKELTWGGLGFGVGIAADFNLSRGTRITDTATAVAVVPAEPGGFVRINEAKNVGVSLVLEAHYFVRDFLSHCEEVVTAKSS